MLMYKCVALAALTTGMAFAQITVRLVYVSIMSRTNGIRYGPGNYDCHANGDHVCP